jgi:hypothetical protein
LRSRRAAFRIAGRRVSRSTGDGVAESGSGPGSHWQSAGMISDATRPGGPSAASTAARLASAISPADLTARVQPTLPVSAAISEVRGASKARCRVA